MRDTFLTPAARPDVAPTNPPPAGSQAAPEFPICYRLAADRRLLDGRCDVTGCGHRYAAPGEAASGLVTHDIPPCLMGLQHHTIVGYDGIRRVALMVTPEGGGDFRDQVWEVMSTTRAILRQQGEPMALTMQTVFVNDAANVPVARRIFEAYYGERMPLTLFVVQPPCDGRGLAIEAWAISTRTARVELRGPFLVTVEHDGLRWIHAASGSFREAHRTAYDQTTDVFEGLRAMLAEAGASFEDVVRIWLYQGGITDSEAGTERYRELNRARTDFFAGIPFHSRPLRRGGDGRAIYPASTGIGTQGRGLVATCLALQTERPDVHLLPLENPLQTSSFDYPEQYSVKTPEVLASHGAARSATT